MAEILFGQSYYLRFDPKLWQAMQPYPPLGTLYAASYLRQRGYKVDLFDAMLAESETEWGQALDRAEPRFAVIFEDNFNYLSKMCLGRMRQAAFAMLAIARERGCTTIVCGSDASDHAQEYMQHGADFVLIGEGEATLGELIDQLSGRSDQGISEILGLTHSQGVNLPRPDLKDLDALPFPAWDLVDVERYRGIWLKRHGVYSMNMVTTRGCPFHCNWCAKPIWGQRYNARSPQNVAAEMLWLKQTYHPDHIWFADDILGLKPGWLAGFAAAVKESDAAIPFKCLNRVDLLQRPGEIDALKQAGCQTIWVGAESGSQKILDAMDKGTRVEQIYETTERLHDADIQVGFFLQFGYPGETRRDIEMTLEMVRRCDPDDIGMSVSYPLPGTRFHEAVRQELGEKKNWEDSSDLAMLYQGPFSTAFYRQLHGVLHKEFRLRKTWKQLRNGSFWSYGSRKATRQLRHFFYNLVSLPFARIKLEKLARDSPHGLDQVLPHLPTSSAANPTPQRD
jgi:radical SAM superfamily enzyme YgiQ (UPF0313 family)